MRLFGIVPVRGRRTTDREIPEGKGGPPDVKKYTLKRVLTSLFTLLAILLVLFILMQLMPGSPFNDEKLTADMRAALYAKYGLDQPIYVQFFRYVGNMLRGDLGVSYNISKNTPISQLIQSRLPISIQVGGMAVTLGAAVGLVLGDAACYVLGTAWFVFQMQCELGYALTVCVYPFIALDLGKIVVSCIVGALLRKRLTQAGVLKLQNAVSE